MRAFKHLAVILALVSVPGVVWLFDKPHPVPPMEKLPSMEKLLSFRDEPGWKILEFTNDGKAYWYRKGKPTIAILNERQLVLAFKDALQGMCPEKGAD